MSLWFVYCDMDSCPWAEVFEADTAEEAVSVANVATWPHVVFPMEALAYRWNGDAASDWLATNPASLERVKEKQRNCRHPILTAPDLFRRPSAIKTCVRCGLTGHVTDFLRHGSAPPSR